MGAGRGRQGLVLGMSRRFLAEGFVSTNPASAAVSRRNARKRRFAFFGTGRRLLFFVFFLPHRPPDGVPVRDGTWLGGGVGCYEAPVAFPERRASRQVLGHARFWSLAVPPDPAAVAFSRFRTEEEIPSVGLGGLFSVH